jgi:maltoporin
MTNSANVLMRRGAIALVAACAAGSSAAVDFGGYFRAGPGATSNNLSRACYGLASPGLKYRLGNECDIYGEFMFSQPFTKDGVEYRASFMPSIFNGATDTGGSELKVAQMFVQAKGFDVLPEATFWIGKRFYGRADVHIVDTFFVKMDGVGGGVDGIAAGPGKLGFAYFREDGDGKQGANRFNVDYGDLAVNPGGKLRFVGNLVDPTFTGGDSGQALTVQHNQENFPFSGAKNVAWLQAAKGSAGLDGNFGNLLANSSDKAWRAVESFNWQRGPWGGQAMALWQQDRPAAGGKTVGTSLGGRVSYAFTKNFKLLAEVGHSTKDVGSGPKQKLTKFTVAPALSTGAGFWDRPELRLYVTHGRWNAAAGADPSNGLPAGRTRNTSYGLQVEMWF